MSHIIVLIQTIEDKPASRTYLDFQNPAQAWDAITRSFEERLKTITPGARNITYDIQELFRYIDTLPDLACLMFV